MTLVADNANLMVTSKEPHDRCYRHRKIWQSLVGAKDKEVYIYPCLQEALYSIVCDQDPHFISQTSQAPFVEDSQAASNLENPVIVVLVTGSLHLVGGVLSHIDSSLTSFRKLPQK